MPLACSAGEFPFSLFVCRARAQKIHKIFDLRWLLRGKLPWFRDERACIEGVEGHLLTSSPMAMGAWASRLVGLSKTVERV